MNIFLRGGGGFMSNNNFSGNITPDKLNAILKMASGKLGMSSEQLKSVLSDKKATENLMNNIGGTDQLKNVLDNPQNLEKFLNANPKAKKLLNELLGDHHNG